MAGSYAEGIGSIQKLYNKPPLAHVHAIVEAPLLKSGNGQEIHHLLDAVKQRMRALQAMNYDSLEKLVSSVTELKLDRYAIFAWQNHRKYQKEVPSYTDLLEFVDLPACA